MYKKICLFVFLILSATGAISDAFLYKIKDDLYLLIQTLENTDNNLPFYMDYNGMLTATISFHASVLYYSINEAPTLGKPKTSPVTPLLIQTVQSPYYHQETFVSSHPILQNDLSGLVFFQQQFYPAHSVIGSLPTTGVYHIGTEPGMSASCAPYTANCALQQEMSPYNAQCNSFCGQAGMFQHSQEYDQALNHFAITGQCPYCRVTVLTMDIYVKHLSAVHNLHH